MSDPRTKAEYSKAKDLRQGLPQREVIHGKKKVMEKPFQVERRYPFMNGYDWLWHKDWRKERCFVNREFAENYIEKELRVSVGFKHEHQPEFRILNKGKRNE